MFKAMAWLLFECFVVTGLEALGFRLVYAGYSGYRLQALVCDM